MNSDTVFEVRAGHTGYVVDILTDAGKLSERHYASSGAQVGRIIEQKTKFAMLDKMIDDAKQSAKEKKR